MAGKSHANRPHPEDSVRHAARPVTVSMTAALVMTALAFTASPGHAQPGPARGQVPAPGMVGAARRAPLPAGQRYVCPAPSRPGQPQCMSIVRSARSAVRSSNFYHPADLRAAYGLTAASARAGRGKTIAIVDAFSNPRAAADLAVYRSRFGLGPCGIRGGCLRIVNEHGRPGPLPKPNWEWATEESVDLDMVSAICPNCRILLIEAGALTFTDFGIAEDTAVRMGAKYISNSWAGGEFAGQDSYDHYFNHPGVVIAFASGDFGYSTAYPADLQYVTSVGGTKLLRAANRRGWLESVWGSHVFGAEGTGSGCSTFEAKPPWQRADDSVPGGCLNRTLNDVSAVGNPDTGVAVYDTYPAPAFAAGWNEFGGTSVATPIITAVYALAGNPKPRTYPSEYPYLHSSGLFPVRSGQNGVCEPYRRYLCHGMPGYNAPAGLGTPDGTSAFTAGSAARVTVLNPGSTDVAAGAPVSVRLAGLDSAGKTLRWTASGLPAGLAVHAIAGGSSALITGTAPAGPAAFGVTVRVTDGAATATTRFSLVVAPVLRDAAQAPAHLVLASRDLCADGGTGAAGQPVRVEHCTGRDTAVQFWSYRPAGVPGAFGRLVAAGRCLTITADSAMLARCDRSRRELFDYLGEGTVRDEASGRCLAVPRLAAGTRLGLAACTLAHRKFKVWRLPAGPIMAAASGQCLASQPGPTQLGHQVVLASCASVAPQRWSMTGTGTIRSTSGLCLDGSGGTVLRSQTVQDGTRVVMNFCADGLDTHQVWLPGPGGQLINAWSGRCLADVPGSGLVQEDCYASASEIWAIG